LPLVVAIRPFKVLRCCSTRYSTTSDPLRAELRLGCPDGDGPPYQVGERPQIAVARARVSIAASLVGSPTHN
jgi:hypothetical protein